MDISNRLVYHFFPLIGRQICFKLCALGLFCFLQCLRFTNLNDRIQCFDRDVPHVFKGNVL